MSRRTSAAVSPPREPPTTATPGMPTTAGPRPLAPQPGSGPAEGGDRVHPHLEEDPLLLEGRVAQRVLLSTGVLLVDPVELVDDPPALLRIVLGDLPDGGRLDAEPVVGVLRVH